MPYSEFTLSKVKEKFGLETDEYTNLFPDVNDIGISELLRDTLEENGCNPSPARGIKQPSV